MPLKKESTLSEDFITRLVNKEGCFDLQFRRDVRHERQNNPTYYRWKVQFVIASARDETRLLERIRKTFDCGQIHFIKNQVRYSVQDIDDLYNIITPFFKKHQLSGNKKKDFDLWVKALEIVYQNKRKNLATWKKKDFQRLIEIQKLIQKYKEKSKDAKWISMAKSIAKTLQN